MTDATKLEMLKIDLGISTNAYDQRLAQYLKTAKASIEREGARLTNSIEDANIQIMYAAWLWRKRQSGEGMPRMLRWLLNNRVFSEVSGSE